MQEIEELFYSVDTNRSGEIDYSEYEEVMGRSMMKRSLHGDNDEAIASKSKLPFHMLAMAYRRRKLIHSTFEGTSTVGC